MGHSSPKLEQFVGSLTEYAPTVPDEITQHCLRVSGMDCEEIPVVRLVSLAAQRLIAGIVSDAFQMQKRTVDLRQKPAKEQAANEEEYILTAQSVADALQEHGIPLKGADYIANEKGGGKRAQTHG